MAILSNINDKFRVDSAGAVYFGTSAGTNLQVLQSIGTSGSPTWVNVDDIIGGPYLPLTGGTLTGNLAINGSNSLTVGGVLNGTTATFSTVQISNGNSYNENIRMFPASNDYSSLVLGAVSGTSGSGVGQWTLVRYPSATYSNKFSIRHNTTDAIVITKEGKVGVSITPSDWNTTALQVGQGSISQDINSVYVGANTYNSSAGWKRINAQLAGYMRMGTNDGIWSFSNAVTGTANSIISWNERMRIDTSGNVMMGKTSQSGNAALTVKSTAGGNTGIILVEGDTVNDGWGVYATTANEYRITRFTNGSYSDKFIITSSGLVGIGVTPDYPLHVTSVDIAAKFVGSQTGYTQGAIVLSSGTDSVPQARGQGVYRFNEGNDETWYTGTAYANTNRYIWARKASTTSLDTSAAQLTHAMMSLTNDGKLGIGTTNPPAPLTIAGSGSDGNALLRLEATGGSQTFNWMTSTVYPNLQSGKTTIHLFGQSESANNQAWVGFQYAGSGSTSNTLSFGFYANNHLVNLRATGNLGIGTTGPTAKLHVLGTTGLPATSGTAFTGTMRLQVAGGYGTVMDFGAVGPSTGTQWIQVTDASNQAIHYPLLLQPNGGNVGIGTISPSVKLEVANKSLTRHSSSSWGQAAVANPNDAEVGFVWAAGGTGYPGITSTYTRQWIAGLSPFGTGTDKWSLTNKTLGSNTAVSFNEAGDVAFGTTDITSDLTFGDRIMKIYGTRATLGLFSTGSLSTISMKASNNSSTAMHLNLDGTVGDLAIYAYAGGGELCRFIGASKRFAIQSTTAYSTLQVGSHMASNELTIGGYYYGGGGSINWRSGHPSNSTVWNMARINVTDDSNYNGRIEFKTTTNGGNTGTEPTTKMVLKASGNLGIGNTSPQTTLHVGTTTTVTNQFTNQVNASNFLVNGNANGGASFFQCKTAAVNINMMGNNDFACNQFTFYHKPLSFSQNVVGTIATFSSSTQYNTTSDYRLKENVIPLSDSIIRLKKLKPSRFNFIQDPERTMDGFLAHEVQDIVPEAVNGEKDAVDENGNEVHQGIDQAKLVPLLVAAIQELEARVKELENK